MPVVDHFEDIPDFWDPAQRGVNVSDLIHADTPDSRLDEIARYFGITFDEVWLIRKRKAAAPPEPRGIEHAKLPF